MILHFSYTDDILPAWMLTAQVRRCNEFPITDAQQHQCRGGYMSPTHALATCNECDSELSTAVAKQSLCHHVNLGNIRGKICTNLIAAAKCCSSRQPDKQDSAGMYISKIFWFKHPGCLSVSKQPAHRSRCSTSKPDVLTCAKLLNTVCHESIRHQHAEAGSVADASHFTLHAAHNGNKWIKC